MADAAQPLRMDFTEWNLGEIEDYLLVAGRDEIPQGEFRPTIRDLRAFAWITLRRNDPAYEFEQTRGIRMSELQEVVANPPRALGGAAGGVGATGSRSSRKPTGTRRPRSGA